MRGQVAQLVEQRTENPCVGGSIPPLATNFFIFLFFYKLVNYFRIIWLRSLLICKDYTYLMTRSKNLTALLGRGGAVACLNQFNPQLYTARHSVFTLIFLDCN